MGGFTLHKILLIISILLIIVGCKNHQPISSGLEKPSTTASPAVVLESNETTKPSPNVTPAVQTDTPIPTPAVTPTSAATIKPMGEVKSTNSYSESDNVITGTFIYPWSNPLNSGTAEVTKLGANKYHLYVSVVHGFGHNIGEIDSDFIDNGKNFVILNDEYKIVTISFTENSITIDYSGNKFGGANAEPKGTFYLKNSGIEDVPFLTKIYDKLKLTDQYRHGFTDVLTYELKDKQVLLVRSKSSIRRTQIVAESLVIYNTSNHSLDVLGEVSGLKSLGARKKLESMKADPELIYQLLHKDWADRFIELEMQKFDNGDRTAGDPDKFKLTDAEAFFIVTGIEGATSISNNTRNADNIGSIFITEVDHLDNKTVTIHIYEMVRNDKDEGHTATADWLEVDRSTGKVSSMIFGE